MEEIEYLEEYKELVLPAIGTFRNTDHSNMANLQEDDDSSSIDQDIFESLFDDNSDDENLLHKKVDPKFYQRREERESMDSLDMLVKELVGDQTSDVNMTLKSLKPVTSISGNTNDTNKFNKNVTLGNVSKDGSLHSRTMASLSTISSKLPKGPGTFHKIDSAQITSPKLMTNVQSSQSKKAPGSSRNISLIKKNSVNKTSVGGSPKLSSTYVGKKVNRGPTTIITSDKARSKDPKEDPLGFDAADQIECLSDSFTLSDVSDDSFSSFTDSDTNNISQNIIELSNDSSYGRIILKDLDKIRGSTPSPTVSEDEIKGYKDEARKSSLKYMVESSTLKKPPTPPEKLLNIEENSKILVPVKDLLKRLDAALIESTSSKTIQHSEYTEKEIENTEKPDKNNRNVQTNNHSKSKHEEELKVKNTESSDKCNKVSNKNTTVAMNKSNTSTPNSFKCTIKQLNKYSVEEEKPFSSRSDLNDAEACESNKNTKLNVSLKCSDTKSQKQKSVNDHKDAKSNTDRVATTVQKEEQPQDVFPEDSFLGETKKINNQVTTYTSRKFGLNKNPNKKDIDSKQIVVNPINIKHEKKKIEELHKNKSSSLNSQPPNKQSSKHIYETGKLKRNDYKTKNMKSGINVEENIKNIKKGKHDQTKPININMDTSPSKMSLKSPNSSKRRQETLSYKQDILSKNKQHDRNIFAEKFENLGSHKSSDDSASKVVKKYVIKKQYKNNVETDTAKTQTLPNKDNKSLIKMKTENEEKVLNENNHQALSPINQENMDSPIQYKKENINDDQDNKKTESTIIDSKSLSNGKKLDTSQSGVDDLGKEERCEQESKNTISANSSVLPSSINDETTTSLIKEEEMKKELINDNNAVDKSEKNDGENIGNKSVIVNDIIQSENKSKEVSPRFSRKRKSTGVSRKTSKKSCAGVGNILESEKDTNLKSKSSENNDHNIRSSSKKRVTQRKSGRLQKGDYSENVTTSNNDNSSVDINMRSTIENDSKVISSYVGETEKANVSYNLPKTPNKKTLLVKNDMATSSIHSEKNVSPILKKVGKETPEKILPSIDVAAKSPTNEFRSGNDQSESALSISIDTPMDQDIGNISKNDSDINISKPNIELIESIKSSPYFETKYKSNNPNLSNNKKTSPLDDKGAEAKSDLLGYSITKITQSDKSQMNKREDSVILACTSSNNEICFNKLLKSENADRQEQNTANKSICKSSNEQPETSLNKCPLKNVHSNDILKSKCRKLRVRINRSVVSAYLNTHRKHKQHKNIENISKPLETNKKSKVKNIAPKLLIHSTNTDTVMKDIQQLPSPVSASPTLDMNLGQSQSQYGTDTRTALAESHNITIFNKSNQREFFKAHSNEVSNIEKPRDTENLNSLPKTTEENLDSVTVEHEESVKSDIQDNKQIIDKQQAVLLPVEFKEELEEHIMPDMEPLGPSLLESDVEHQTFFDGTFITNNYTDSNNYDVSSSSVINLNDYCCPSFDDPNSGVHCMSDETQCNALAHELPSYIVMTTKLITRADLEQNKTAIPASIRQKVEKITNMTSPTSSVQSSVSFKSQENCTDDPSIIFNYRNSVQKEIPYTSMTSRTDPNTNPNIQFDNNDKELIQPLNSILHSTGNVPSISNETIYDCQRSLLRSSMRRFDAVIKKHCTRIISLSFVERQKIISNVTSNCNFTAKEVDIATKLFEECALHISDKVSPSKYIPIKDLDIPQAMKEKKKKKTLSKQQNASKNPTNKSSFLQSDNHKNEVASGNNIHTRNSLKKLFSPKLCESVASQGSKAKTPLPVTPKISKSRAKLNSSKTFGTNVQANKESDNNQTINLLKSQELGQKQTPDHLPYSFSPNINKISDIEISSPHTILPSEEKLMDFNISENGSSRILSSTTKMVSITKTSNMPDECILPDNNATVIKSEKVEDDFIGGI